MTDERRAILSLIAAGRITPAEAERLIAAWQDAREWVWLALGCLAVCLLGAHPHWGIDGLPGLLHSIVAQGTRLLHAAAVAGIQGRGGSL
ncbi:hypothetical protein DYQ86_04030 [Acidobacteria bacterium AB60]|nr:hypothetical protein DYQ86_04030 [Acidobacteria bacterium AB60]